MPGGGKKEVTWNAEMDVKLFLTILDMNHIKVDCEAIAKRMATEDSKPTASSISNRMAKLKAAAKKQGGGGAPGSDEDSPKPNARKRGSTSCDASGGTAKKARKATKVETEPTAEDQGEYVLATRAEGNGSGDELF